jgi:hypothetical protein
MSCRAYGFLLSTEDILALLVCLVQQFKQQEALRD